MIIGKRSFLKSVFFLALSLPRHGFSINKSRVPPDSWKVSSHRIHPPTKVIPINDIEFCKSTSVVTTVTPEYPVTSIRIAFSNWATLTTGIQSPEVDGESELTVRATIIKNGKLFAKVTFSGSISVSIPPGESVWSDEITVPSWISQDFEIRTFCQVSLDGVRPGGYRKNNRYEYHDGVHYGTSQIEHERILTGGKFANSTARGYEYYYGPSMVLANNWDGRPVILCIGDSIAYGDDFACSWLTTAINSSIGSRLPYFNISVQGIRPTGLSSLAKGQFKRKFELLKSAQVVTGSKSEVFTCIISELGVNDAWGNNGDLLLQKLRGYWLFLKDCWPDTKLIQTTFTPRAKKDLIYFNSSEERQLSTTTTPADADRWYVSEIIKNKPYPLEGYIDLRKVWTGKVDGCFWREVWKGDFLLEDLLPGSEFCVLGSAPKLGALIVFSAGRSQEEVEFPYAEVIDVSGHGPFIVRFSSGCKKYHPKGRLVVQTMTRDGIHPEGVFPNFLATEEVIKAKINGMFSR